MELAMIGLGKMGFNMATRLVRGGIRVVGYDRSAASVEAVKKNGAEGAASLEETIKMLPSPHILWMMLPAGAPTEDTITQLAGLLDKGDIVIDGGNSNYKESVRRAGFLESKGIEFVDCGTSGGIWGLAEGYSMMIGGKSDIVEKLRPIFETLAPAADKGWGYVGPHGAGHFVKMVHNGIEYGMMQSYAEGFDILRAKQEFSLDLGRISEIWRYGSVVRSWLLDLTARALEADPTLSDLEPWVEDSGEGR
ncbi:MAG TPA: decarboxylating 6-phosphogluconate dehydrogenase, partial [Anaerolineales bacterium]|nr:decarboxylating 6-phosphogluconate dehydrogenase [Anaerolineales bacterium]